MTTVFSIQRTVLSRVVFQKILHYLTARATKQYSNDLHYLSGILAKIFRPSENERISVERGQKTPP